MVEDGYTHLDAEALLANAFSRLACSAIESDPSSWYPSILSALDFPMSRGKALDQSVAGCATPAAARNLGPAHVVIQQLHVSSVVS